MAGDKSSDAEIQYNVNRIVGLLIAGLTRTSDIQRYIADMDALSEKDKLKRKIKWKPINKSERIIEGYIAKARKIINEQSIQDIKEIKELYAARLEDIFQKARAKGSLQTANNIMKNLIYLQGIGGLNLKGAIDITSFDVQLTDEEQAEFKKKLKLFGGEDILIDDLGNK